MEKLIDIIIPAYKAHKTLFKTLASIAAQTMSENLTVVVVNDCCPEGSYQDIIDHFKSELDITEIILKKNVGPGAARQVGIDSTLNSFIMFCDADDVFASPTAVEILFMNIMSNGANVIGSSFIEQTAPGIYVPHNDDMVWVFDKIYRRDFLVRYDISFTESRANEDTCFNRKVIIAQQTLGKPIISINFVSYVWTNRNQQSITRANSGQYTYDQNIVGFIDGMIECIDWMERQHIHENIIKEQIYGCTVFLYLASCHMLQVAKQEFVDQAFNAMRKFLQIVSEKYTLDWYSPDFLGEYESHLEDLKVNNRFSYIMIMEMNFWQWLKFLV